jgi:hypothetical protein
MLVCAADFSSAAMDTVVGTEAESSRVNPRDHRPRASAWRKACGTVIFGAVAHWSITFLTCPSIWLTSMTRIQLLPLRKV